MPERQQNRVLYSQNFLKSSSLVQLLLDKSTVGPDDIVYEIGPGRGIITLPLSRRCRQVIAIEKDLHLVSCLRSTFTMSSNIKICQGDFLHYTLPRQGHYKVFANIPFNITSEIMTRLTTVPMPPDDAYLVMQREAAEKFLGVPHSSLYSILLQPCFDLELFHRFQRSDFVPAPRVDVVMLRMRKRGPPLISQSEMSLFRDFVVYCFTTFQPSLKNTLKHLLGFRQYQSLARSVNFDLAVSPTTLRFTQWHCLFDAFKHTASPYALLTINSSEQRLHRQQATLEKSHRTRVSFSVRRK
jgi:23S rRNA (adenine-N6)-dimethyltransferase